MATTIPTTFKKSQLINAGPQIKFDTDTLVCFLVVAGSGAPSTIGTGVQYISDVTATNSEVTGTGYARQTLTGVTIAVDGSVNTQVDFSFGAITYAQNAAGFTNARYAILAKNTGVDSTSPVFAVCDLITNQSVVVGSLILNAPSGGLIQWN